MTTKFFFQFIESQIAVRDTSIILEKEKLLAEDDIIFLSLLSLFSMMALTFMDLVSQSRKTTVII